MPNATCKNRKSIRWLLAVAVAGPAMGLLAPSAEAQYRVQGQDGSARDANNRVGSGGSNAGPSRYGTGVTPDMIIYGNVTNSKYFRGPTAAPDARAFRGATADLISDRFIRDSSGGYDRLPPSSQLNPTPYYGDSRGVAAPAGYVPTKTTYTYNPNLYTPAYGSAANLASLSTGEGLVPRLGTTINALPTPTSGEQGRSLLIMSPLGGIRQLPLGADDPAGPNDIYMIRNGAVVPTGMPTDRFRTDGQTIDRIRGELTSPGQEDGTSRPRDPAAQPLGQPLGAPLESPASSQLPAQQAPGGTPIENAPLGSSLNTGQAGRRQLISPAQQSAQMGELERRLRERQGNPAPTDRGNIVRPNVPAKPAVQPPPGGKPGEVTPGTVTPGEVTPGNARPALPAPGAARPVTPPGAVTPGAGNDPLLIKSLATGVRAKSLADVLTRAEALMKEGKFAEAQDQYDLAERAAPNNALITLGRSHAELGASSYRSAETHLRQALSNEPALLLGRYDLKSMIGADRLSILTKDLKDLAANEPREAMAPFLLAYILYNTGNVAEAAVQLNDVEKRQNGPDPLVAKMRELWSLPGGGLNK